MFSSLGASAWQWQWARTMPLWFLKLGFQILDKPSGGCKKALVFLLLLCEPWALCPCSRHRAVLVSLSRWWSSCTPTTWLSTTPSPLTRTATSAPRSGPTSTSPSCRTCTTGPSPRCTDAPRHRTPQAVPSTLQGSLSQTNLNHDLWLL